uniref:SCP domain-containing protein n=1 Tax=Mesocestoides corti TaxID=53468 RepID=A0A5K3G076_MESCO
SALFQSYSTKAEELAVRALNICDTEKVEADPLFNNVGAFVVALPSRTLQYGELCNVAKFQYDLEPAKCSPDCHNYKQIVFAASTGVGCAIGACKTNNLANVPLNVMVCIYNPGVLRITQPPYESGSACSNCPNGYECYRKQCRKILPTTTTTTPSASTTTSSLITTTSTTTSITPILILQVITFFLHNVY